MEKQTQTLLHDETKTQSCSHREITNALQVSGIC